MNPSITLPANAGELLFEIMSYAINENIFKVIFIDICDSFL